MPCHQSGSDSSTARIVLQKKARVIACAAVLETAAPAFEPSKGGGHQTPSSCLHRKPVRDGRAAACRSNMGGALQVIAMVTVCSSGSMTR